MGKRIFDIAAAALGLLTLSPLLLILGSAAALTDGFPVLFRQRRVGWRGRDFTLLKLRSMTVQAGAEKGGFDAGRAKRVTRLGRFLRRTKLDELPQLWNVLKGDMSLVGPRPEVRKWVEVFPARWAIVHQVRPGMTDPASIMFRDEEEILAGSPDPERTYREEILPRKLGLYEEYVRTRSLTGDLRLILWTLREVVLPGTSQRFSQTRRARGRS